VIGIPTLPAQNPENGTAAGDIGFANDAKWARPAAQAGLRHGVTGVAVNGRPIADEADLAALLLTEAPGTRVAVPAQRGLGQETVQIPPGERPAG